MRRLFTVAENIWIQQEPLNRIGGVSTRRLRKKTQDLFHELGIEGINPDREVRLLSVADRHLVETALSVDELAPEAAVMKEVRTRSQERAFIQYWKLSKTEKAFKLRPLWSRSDL